MFQNCNYEQKTFRETSIIGMLPKLKNQEEKITNAYEPEKATGGHYMAQCANTTFSKM